MRACNLKTVSLHFLIDPVPKGRPRFTRSGHVYTPKKTKEFEKLVKLKARQAVTEQLEGPLEMEVMFFIRKPKTVKREYPEVKPDLDNLEKALKDALNGVVYRDDAQIVRKISCKLYDTHGSIQVKISQIGDIELSVFGSL